MTIKKTTIKIPMEPLSINKVHCRDQRYYTTEFKDWAGNVLYYLGNEKNQKCVEFVKEHFIKGEHYFKITINSFYPRDQMFTKKGDISSKTHDVSNIEKPLIDVVFTPKFHGEKSTIKGKNINIDDKYIKKMTSEQYCADSHLIELKIEIRPVEELESVII